MFRHQKPTDVKTVADSVLEKEAVQPAAVSDKKVNDEVVKMTSDATIKDLLEKNLKWSQIIYEQNRKINSKLLWAAIGSWIKVFIILIPLILAVLFLAPMARNLSAMYSELLMGGAPNVKSADSLEQILKLFPLNSAQQEQLKAILK